MILKFYNLVVRVWKTKDYTGLSYQLSKSTSGEFTITSIQLINSTGKLIAIKDGKDHVSVIPINTIKMQGWIDSRPTALTNPHEYTILLQSISIKIGK